VPKIYPLFCRLKINFAMKIHNMCLFLAPASYGCEQYFCLPPSWLPELDPHLPDLLLMKICVFLGETHILGCNCKSDASSLNIIENITFSRLKPYHFLTYSNPPVCVYLVELMWSGGDG
jgi:hypothetical protein